MKINILITILATITLFACSEPEVSSLEFEFTSQMPHTIGDQSLNYIGQPCLPKCMDQNGECDCDQSEECQIKCQQDIRAATLSRFRGKICELDLSCFPLVDLSEVIISFPAFDPYSTASWIKTTEGSIFATGHLVAIKDDWAIFKYRVKKPALLYEEMSIVFKSNEFESSYGVEEFKAQTGSFKGNDAFQID